MTGNAREGHATLIPGRSKVVIENIILQPRQSRHIALLDVSDEIWSDLDINRSVLLELGHRDDLPLLLRWKASQRHIIFAWFCCHKFMFVCDSEEIRDLRDIKIANMSRRQLT